MDSAERRDIPGYEGVYTITSDGKVHNAKGYLMVGWKNSDGYPCVKLSLKGVQKSYLVHRLVLLTFVGPCPDACEARHLDGNPSNASVNNLKWDTPKANASDKRQHGTHQGGTEASGWGGKLTEEDVLRMRERIIEGDTTENVAKDYKMRVEDARHIISGRRWGHVKKAVTRQRRTGKILRIDL